MDSTDQPPAAEADRLARLRELLVLDTEPEPLFDSLARLASEVCGTPIALLSLVDHERQWFKANVGLPGVNETPRDVAFCAHAIRGDDLFEVQDATLDGRFATNPLVAGVPDIRFYAGAPLVLPGGERIGTLCVIDRQARCLDAAQAKMLQRLACIATEALVMRRELIDKSLAVRSAYEQALASSADQHRAIVEEQTELVSLARADGELVYTNPSYARFFGRTPEQMAGSNLFDYVDPPQRETVRARIAQIFLHGVGEASENRMLGADGSERWVSWSNSVQQDADGAPLLRSVGRDVTERRRAETALRAAQAFLTRTGKIAGVGGWELDLASGAITWSDETRRIHEVAPNYQPTLESAISFYAPGARELIDGAVRAAMERGDPWDLELPFVTATGRAIWVRSVGEVERQDGQAIRMAGTFQDITGRRAAERELLVQTATLRSVTEAIPAIVSAFDGDLRFRFVNGAFERWYDLPRDQVLGRRADEVIPAEEHAHCLPWAQRALAGETVEFERDYPDRPGAPHMAVSYIPLRLDDGRIDGFIGVAQDITEHREEQERLQQLAQRDTLTGLLNRAGFEQQMEQALLAGEGAGLALLYIDLDRFKAVNDTHGHPVGDSLLHAFGQRLGRLVRPSDAVARLGGDEFALLLAGLPERSNAQRVADKVIAAAQTPFELGGLLLTIGASVGIAYGADPDTGWRELLARADAMLYRAKQGGRGRYAVEGSLD